MQLRSGRSAIPQHLYHYTSIYGVEGILKNQTVWASVVHFLNDSTEWKYALDLAHYHLGRQKATRDDPHWRSLIDKLDEEIGRFDQLYVCAFSLSAMWNQLSQWRAYCPPDGGYALKFDSQALIPQLAAQGFSLHECEYNSAVHADTIQKLISSVLGRIAQPIPDTGIPGVMINSVHNQLVGRLLNLAPLFKHPDFREEYEWRAVGMGDITKPSMDYHIRGQLSIPHINIKLDQVSGDFPITEIIVGPGKHKELAMRGLAPLVQKTKVKGVSVSQTPLRNL